MSMRCYRVLLPHPLESRLLMMHRDGDWRLPEWDEHADQAWWLTDHVNRAIAARFGMETTVLRCVSDDVAAGVRVYELDNHSPPHDVAPGCTWIGRTELDLLPVADEATRVLIEDWFRRDGGEVALQGSPWTRRGWYVQALAWAIARLGEAGIVATDAPRQLRAWERAFLMRIPTTDGAFYFRAAPEQCVHEPRLMRWLERHYPGNVPEIAATDEDRGWFLQRVRADGALLLEQVREEEEWYRAIRRFGEMQQAAASDARELHALGLPYRGLDVLAYRIPQLCAAAARPPSEGGAGLTQEEAARLQELVPTLLAFCRELASHDLPDTLEHGNLTAHAVLSSLAGPYFLDWTDCSIAHPFFSPAMLMNDATALLPASSRESRPRLRDSYLAAWSGRSDDADLQRAFALAQRLAPIHIAASIHADVLPVAGYAWEVAGPLAAQLRAVLQQFVDDGGEAVVV
jgi:hypothetical protein